MSPSQSLLLIALALPSCRDRSAPATLDAPTHSSPAPSPSALLSSPAPADSAKPKLTADAARAAVVPWLQPLLGDRASRASLPERTTSLLCDGTSCRWRFQVVSDDGSEQGVFEVDDATSDVRWTPNDGRFKSWKPAEYADFLRRQDAVVAAVTSLPDVKNYCTRLRKAPQPATCMIWAEDEPTTECPAIPAPRNDCLWSVYVGESQTTHAVRFATMYVNPKDMKVIAANGIACDPMTLAEWRLVAHKGGCK